jgi:hypothetical protein
MSTSLQTTIQHAIQANANLAGVMSACKSINNVSPTGNQQEWQTCLQEVYEAYTAAYSAPTPKDFTAAIYTTWAVGQPTIANLPNRLSSAIMINGLQSIQVNNTQVYSQQIINATIPQFYAIINIVIDTALILQQQNNNSNSLNSYAGNYITMNDNEPTSQGEGGDELVTSGLIASQTIEWTATNKSGNAIINFTQFVAGSSNLYTMIYQPVKINDTQFYTQVLPQPNLQEDSYRFEFTLNGGSTTYTWDPWLI